MPHYSCGMILMYSMSRTMSNQLSTTLLASFFSPLTITQQNVNELILLFNIYLLSTYVPFTVLRTGDRITNK